MIAGKTKKTLKQTIKDKIPKKMTIEKRCRLNALARTKIAEGAKTLKGKIGEVGIKCEYSSNDRTVKAAIYGDLAIDKRSKDWWVITHIPSGWSLGRQGYGTKAKAAEVVWLMQQGLDLSSVQLSKEAISELKARIRWYKVLTGDLNPPSFLTDEVKAATSAAPSKPVAVQAGKNVALKRGL